MTLKPNTVQISINPETRFLKQYLVLRDRLRQRQNTLTLEEWGYPNKGCLRSLQGLQPTEVSSRLCSRASANDGFPSVGDWRPGL